MFFVRRDEAYEPVDVVVPEPELQDERGHVGENDKCHDGDENENHSARLELKIHAAILTRSAPVDPAKTRVLRPDSFRLERAPFARAFRRENAPLRALRPG